jgi:hypothetical protein
MAILDLPEVQRQEPIQVISTNTLVEQPLVADSVHNSLACIREAACAQKLQSPPSASSGSERRVHSG